MAIWTTMIYAQLASILYTMQQLDTFWFYQIRPSMWPTGVDRGDICHHRVSSKSPETHWWWGWNVSVPRWRHNIKTIPEVLARCERNPVVIGGQLCRAFMFSLLLDKTSCWTNTENKRLSIFQGCRYQWHPKLTTFCFKWTNCWWFEMPWCSSYMTVMIGALRPK